MKVNNYLQFIQGSDERFWGSRIVIVPSKDERTRLRNAYSGLGKIQILRASDFVEDDSRLPMPDEMLLRVKEQIREINRAGHVALILGLPGYLLLLDQTNTYHACELFRSILDDASLHGIILLRRAPNEFKEIFNNPRYSDSLRIVYIDGVTTDDRADTRVTFIDKKWSISGGHSEKSIREYLQECEEETNEDNVCVTVDYAGHELPGLSSFVRQICSEPDYMREFYGINKNLSEKAYSLIRSIVPDRQQVISTLKYHFFKDSFRDVVKDAPHIIIMRAGTVEQEVLFWLLPEIISEESYLSAVLKNDDLGLLGFMHCYVCEAANFLEAEDSMQCRLAEERKLALSADKFESGDIEPFVRKFIDWVTDRRVESVIKWFNLGTDVEFEEIIRRIQCSELVCGSEQILKVIPLLDDYFADYELGYTSLNDYFQNYRIQKLKNKVSEDFCLRAAKEEIPSDIKSRDSLVQAHVKDEGACLIVVDALGVEYIPMILQLAQSRGIHVESCEVGTANLPCSTKFNPICWPHEQPRQTTIHLLDNFVHSGDNALGNTTSEHNFVANLNRVKETFQRIVHEYYRSPVVIVTSDHGASRLAVCAHKQGLSHTIELPVGTEIDDWRYTKTPANTKIPAGVVTNFEGTYWVIKGYDRFGKQGGKTNELHGGATPEEILVPVIVFKQDGKALAARKENRRTKTASKAIGLGTSQITEKEDFDI